LISAIFPSREDLSNIERLALSFGSSIAVVAIVGLIANFSPWGVRLYPILISIIAVIVITSAVSYFRQRKLPADKVLYISIKATLPAWAGMNRLNRGLFITLIVAIVVALGIVGYTTAVPRQGEKFTEFYILGTDKNISSLPYKVLPGEPVDMVIHVINHEHEPTSYRVRITLDDIEQNELNIGPLDHDEKYEELISILPTAVGNRQKVNFYLYKNNEDKPLFDNPLYLYLDVVTFRIVDMEGKSINYTQQLDNREPAEITIEILHTEPQNASYRVNIKTGDTLWKEITTEVLTEGEKWQKKVGFTPGIQGTNIQVDFWLYKDTASAPLCDTPSTIFLNIDPYPRNTIAKPSENEGPTEFYILNANDKTDVYPWQIEPGIPVDLIVKLVNHEQEPANYQIKILLNGTQIDSINSGLLNDSEGWQKNISITPSTTGDKQKLEFWLYENNSNKPYHEEPLFIYLDVYPLS